MVAAKHHLASLEELCAGMEFVDSAFWNRGFPYQEADLFGEIGEEVEGLGAFLRYCAS